MANHTRTPNQTHPDIRQRCYKAMMQIQALENYTMPEQELAAAAYQVLANILSGHTSDLSRDEARDMFTKAAALPCPFCYTGGHTISNCPNIDPEQLAIEHAQQRKAAGMPPATVTVGAIVRFAEPDADERGSDERFLVLEDRDNRVLVGALGFEGWRIPPTFVYLKSDLVVAND